MLVLVPNITTWLTVICEASWCHLHRCSSLVVVYLPRVCLVQVLLETNIAYWNWRWLDRDYSDDVLLLPVFRSFQTLKICRKSPSISDAHFVPSRRVCFLLACFICYVICALSVYFSDSNLGPESRSLYSQISDICSLFVVGRLAAYLHFALPFSEMWTVIIAKDVNYTCVFTILATTTKLGS